MSQHIAPSAGALSRVALGIAVVALSACSASRLPEPIPPDRGVILSAGEWLEDARRIAYPFRPPFGTGIDTIRFDEGAVRIEFSRELARYPFRTESADGLVETLRRSLEPYLQGRPLEVFGSPLRFTRGRQAASTTVEP
jgi:hypothetical protein